MASVLIIPAGLAGDLFDFDFEVEPILEVLVGKVLEQGLMEVLEEEELAAMRAHQEHFEQIRNAELVATQRMEAAEKRKIEEKERRMAQVRRGQHQVHLQQCSFHNRCMRADTFPPQQKHAHCLLLVAHNHAVSDINHHSDIRTEEQPRNTFLDH